MDQGSSTLTPMWLQERFPSDQKSALNYFRKFVDAEMLTTIAAADYGHDTKIHLEALKPIWEKGDLDGMDVWYPMEVLELIRWSEPDQPEWKPGESGEEGHIMRAFSCSVLLASPSAEPTKETLIQLVNSALFLGINALEATGRFLTWRIDSLQGECDRPFFVLALAAIVQELESDLGLRKEQRLADWIQEEEQMERDYLSSFSSEYKTVPWLFGLSFNDMLNKRWKGLIKRMKNSAGASPLGCLLDEYTDI